MQTYVLLESIDELDAGIFEYMLGELLDIFGKSAKGQLIFTSHNLRALEMLGGQDEQIYEETDSLKIARAFRKAGRSLNNE